MLDSVRQLYALLSSTERQRALKVFALMATLALLEATGVADSITIEDNNPHLIPH